MKPANHDILRAQDCFQKKYYRKTPGQSAAVLGPANDARAQRVLTYFQPIATSNFTLVFQQHDQQSLQNSEIGNISTMEYAECSLFPPDPLARFLLRAHADYPMLLFAYCPHSALPIRMSKHSPPLTPSVVPLFSLLPRPIPIPIE